MESWWSGESVSLLTMKVEVDEDIVDFEFEEGNAVEKVCNRLLNHLEEVSSWEREVRWRFAGEIAFLIICSLL